MYVMLHIPIKTTSTVMFIIASRAVRLRLELIMDHLAFRIFTLLLILADLAVIIVDLCSDTDRHALEITAVAIGFYFLLEVILRIMIKG